VIQTEYSFVVVLEAGLLDCQVFTRHSQRLASRGDADSDDEA